MPTLHAENVKLRDRFGGDWGRAFKSAREELDRRKIFALVGARGTGKTQLAACLLAELVMRDQTVQYSVAADLFSKIRASYSSPESKSEYDIVQNLISYGGLVIDELHESKGSEHESRILTGLVDRRYGRLRHTILISNQTAEDFERLVGPSVVSRMQEIGMLIECSWPSFRNAGAE